MTWLEEHKQYINKAIHRFFEHHYRDDVSESEKVFQEAVLYAVSYGNPSRIHPILSMVAYEEVLGLLAADSVVDVLVGLEFIHLGMQLHADVSGVNVHHAEDDMPVIKKYGSAVTVFVGDALIQLGMDCLVRGGKMNVIQEISHAIGDFGAVRGFARDITTNRDTITESEYIALYDEELSKLVGSSFVIGAFIAGDVQQIFIDGLKRFATFLIRMYQVRLDIAEYERTKDTPQSSSRKRGVVDFLGYEKAQTLRATIEYELVKMTNNYQSPKFKDVVEFFAKETI